MQCQTCDHRFRQQNVHRQDALDVDELEHRNQQMNPHVLLTSPVKSLCSNDIKHTNVPQVNPHVLLTSPVKSSGSNDIKHTIVQQVNPHVLLTSPVKSSGSNDIKHTNVKQPPSTMNNAVANINHQCCVESISQKEHSKICTQKEKKVKNCDSKSVKENNILNSWKSYFSRWIHDSKTNKEMKWKSNSEFVTNDGTMKIIVSQKSGRNSPDSLNDNLLNSPTLSTNGYLNLACPQFPQECTDVDIRCVHNVTSLNSSFDSEFLLHHYTNISESLCSTTSNKQDKLVQSCQIDTEMMNSDVCRAVDSVGLANWKTQVDYSILSKQNPRHCKKLLLQTHGQLIQTISCPTKSKSFQSQNSKLQKSILSSSWPSCFQQTFFSDADDEFNGVTCARKNSFGRYQLQEYEFNIPFCDIKFHECIQNGKRKKLFRGQWHGEVMIHLFENLNHEERGVFWKEISRLSLIRHENISLFMGASMEPPKFAVVTSARKGPSLYEKMHLLREKAASSLKLAIVQQIAQAVGYLHAKGMIAAQSLNSKNIFLEPRAKLCLIDSTVIEDAFESSGYVSLSPTLVYYISPEILALCSTVKPRRVAKSYFSTASDVFAFSTIMFEVHCGRYPFHTLEVDSFIVNIGRGKREDVRHLRTSDVIKHLIQDGWMHDSLFRPDFADINGKLKNRKALYKPSSTSEPENLHRLNNRYKFGYIM